MQPRPEACGPGFGERLARVGAIVDATLVDLALLMAGREAGFGGFDPELARVVGEALSPFLEAGWRLDPDFGDRANADVAGLDEPGPVDVHLTFQDRSVAVAPDGRRRAPAESWWRLGLRIDPEAGRLLAMAVGRP